MVTTQLHRDTLADTVVASIHAMAAVDLDELRLTVHPDAVNREALAEPPDTRGHGPEAFLATARWLATAFADLAFDIDTVVVEGDLVVTHGTMSGRQTGDFVIWTPEGRVERAFAPTGKTFEVRHAHFARMRDDLVVEHWAVRDDQGMALQLGWVPPSPWYLLRCAVATSRARRAAARERRGQR
jgi:predicted ester cyclase